MNNCKNMGKKCEYADRLGLCGNLTATCARRSEMSDQEYEIKKAKCDVCGLEFNPHSDGICIENPIIGGPYYWDFMNCPYCGCQVLLKKRLPIFDEYDGEEQNDE